MATYSKPAKVPRWADTTANILEPSEPYKDGGHALGVEPPSNFENWKENLNGSWWKWLDERLADGGTADELVILSPATTNEMFKLSNAIAKWSSAAGIEFEAVAGIFTAGRTATNGINLKGIGNQKDIEFDGTLNRMSYNVSTDIWSLFNDSATASLTVSKTLIAAKKAVTLDADLDVTVSGAGEYKHGDKILTINALPGNGGNFSLVGSGYVQALSTIQAWYLPIPLDEGCRIRSIAVRAYGASTGTKTGDLLSNSATTSSPTNQATDSWTTSGEVTRNMSAIDYTIGSDTIWFAFGSADIGDRIMDIKVTYDRP